MASQNTQFFLELILHILAATYLTKVFLITHVGPGGDKSKTILYKKKTGEVVLKESVGWFDQIRSFSFDKEGDIWYLKHHVWTCPYCLGFWVNIPFLFLYWGDWRLMLLLLFSAPMLIGRLNHV